MLGVGDVQGCWVQVALGVPVVGGIRSVMCRWYSGVLCVGHIQGEYLGVVVILVDVVDLAPDRDVHDDDDDDNHDANYPAEHRHPTRGSPIIPRFLHPVIIRRRGGRH